MCCFCVATKQPVMLRVHIFFHVLPPWLRPTSNTGQMEYAYSTCHDIELIYTYYPWAFAIMHLLRLKNGGHVYLELSKLPQHQYRWGVIVSEASCVVCVRSGATDECGSWWWHYLNRRGSAMCRRGSAMCLLASASFLRNTVQMQVLIYMLTLINARLYIYPYEHLRKAEPAGRILRLTKSTICASLLTRTSPLDLGFKLWWAGVQPPS
jgi:hypothetical protein